MTTRYRLHCLGASGNSYKVALFLTFADLHWEPVGVDFTGGRTRDPAWRAGTNAMGEVPVLEVDGRYLSQSGAILTWLAETHGKFAPEEDDRLEALRWLLFDTHKFTSGYAQHRMALSIVPETPHPSLIAYLRGRAESALSIVDKHLANRSYVLGDRLTIIDFSLAGYIYYPAEETGFDIAASFPNIDAWRRRLAALPGWKPPYEMMPVGSPMPVVRPYRA